MNEYYKKPRIKPIDATHATFLGSTSRIASIFPDNANAVGRSASQNHVPTRWFHARTAADSLPDSAYASFEALLQKRIILPSRMTMAALVYVDREGLDNLQFKYESKQAMTYMLGSTLMAGVSAERQLFGLEHPDSEYYTFAARHGGGPLDIGVGVRPDGLRDKILPLTSGVFAGPVMPIADLAPHVRLI